MTRDDRDFPSTLPQRPSPAGFEMPDQQVRADHLRPIDSEVAGGEVACVGLGVTQSTDTPGIDPNKHRADDFHQSL